MFNIDRARFATFAQAAACAVKHAQQRGECQVRLANGTLLADFRPHADGTVSIAATDVGAALVLELAR